MQSGKGNQERLSSHGTQTLAASHKKWVVPLTLWGNVESGMVTVDLICKENSLELKPVKTIKILHRNGNKTGIDTMLRKVTNVAWDAYKDKEGKDLTYQLEENGPEITWMYAVYEMEMED